MTPTGQVMDRLSRVGSLAACMLSVHTIYNSSQLRGTPAGDRNGIVPDLGERVVVCIPARNEATRIGTCVRAVLGSTGIADLSLVVLDDASEDDTSAAIVDAFGNDDRASLIAGTGGPPPGWLGKTWACQRLYEHSQRIHQPGWFVFIDADVRLEPHAIASAIDLCKTASLDGASPYPRQEALSPMERIVQPLLQWSWLTFVPLRLSERPQPVSLAVGNGQFFIVSERALCNVGGFASVRGEVLDDVALVRALKRAGHRVTVVDGTTLATCRMYEDWSSLRDGYSKNLWSATGSPFGASALAAFLAVTYVVPPLAGIAGFVDRRRARALLGTLGYLVGVFGRMVCARRTGGNVRDSFAHPLSIVVLVQLIGRSWRERRRGTLRWKGRPIRVENPTDPPAPVRKRASS